MARSSTVHVGKTFGRLTVEEVYYDRRAMFRCRCACGTTKEVRASRVLEGTSLSCGCLRRSDFVGKRFGRLTVISAAGVDEHQYSLWLCRCKCGKEITAVGGSLTTGNTSSCGCFRQEVWHSTKRSESREQTKEYNAWRLMRQRCNNPKNADYKDYGGRGIKVSSQWGGKFGYVTFLRDVGRAPSAEHSLDRYPDVNGDYRPGNVRWATDEEQARNKRLKWSGKIHVDLRDPMLRKVYGAWSGMKQRCLNEKHHQYKRYGGTGITVCGKWQLSFEAFLADVGLPPTKQHTLDRYPVCDGNYEPGNVRWSTPKDQALNRRTTVFLTGAGRTLCIADWGRFLNLTDGAIRYWLNRDKVDRRYHRNGASLMTKRLPVVTQSVGQKGEEMNRVDQRSRLLIVCPLADIYSG